MVVHRATRFPFSFLLLIKKWRRGTQHYVTPPQVKYRSVFIVMRRGSLQLKKYSNCVGDCSQGLQRAGRPPQGEGGGRSCRDIMVARRSVGTRYMLAGEVGRVYITCTLDEKHAMPNSSVRSAISLFHLLFCRYPLRPTRRARPTDWWSCGPGLSAQLCKKQKRIFSTCGT